MEFRLLGEVRVAMAGRALDVGTPRQQVVLAALAVDAGRPVPIEVLVDRVWDDDPPAGARNVLYSHLSRIRRLVAGSPARLVRRHAGYVLDVDPDLVDLHRFRRLVDAGDPERALALWRGEPLAHLPGAWAAQVRAYAHRQRVDAVVRWAGRDLASRPTQVLAALADVLPEYPLVEPLEALYLRALCACGRTAEALDRYGVFRVRLADELGTDPGPELRELHRAMLRGAVPAGPTAGPVAMLPPDVSGFTGRDHELRALDEHPTGVVVIDGTPGVGKTALAVHWAHRERTRFPDGQLYVNLRGFDPTGAPVTAGEAVLGFLDALDVPPDRVPSTVEARVGLYRSRLAGRRLLVLLDNARDADQVRPLLPGAPDCLALVTSRNQLAGLVAEGAHPVTLDLLTPEGGRALLTSRLGARRVADEPAVADEIVALCAGLPLALAIVAGRAASHPTFRLVALADELREARLDAFATADLSTDVRAVFSWSYGLLSPPAARLFRLLGLHPGPDIGVAAAAALLGDGPVRPPLAELARAHLVGEPTPGRFTLHDLLRAYARELIDDERPGALRRMLDHYLATAHRAALALNPYRLPIALDTTATPEELDDATAWFTREHRVLIAAIRLADDAGLDSHTWRLAWTLMTFLDRHGLWPEWAETQCAALAAAERLGDVAGQAWAHRSLAGAYTRLGRFDDTHTHLALALDGYREVGDPSGQAHVHRDLGWVLGRQGRYDAALDHARQALDRFRAAGDRAGEARALNAVGWYHAQLGGYREALAYCRDALDLHRAVGNRAEEAHTWDSLGYAHRHLGQGAEAVGCYEQARRLHHETGDLYHEAETLTNLGDTHHALREDDAARAAWLAALATLEQLGHAETDAVHARLRRLAPGGR